MCPETPRWRLKRPRECCLLVVQSSYFFFAAFFAAFFAGAFLAAFFVAICLFSLFRWVASNLQLNIAVEECIDSCFNIVKKKTTQRWKKWQQFFRIAIEDRNGTSHDVMRFEQCEHQSSEEIVPAVRENSSAQTASKESEQTE